MSVFPFLTNIWTILKEADLGPLRQRALRGVRIAVVGEPGSGRKTLLDHMRRDPARPNLATDTPALVLRLDEADQALDADLIILIIDARKTDTQAEQELVKTWHHASKKVLVFINQFASPAELESGGRSAEASAIELRAASEKPMPSAPRGAAAADRDRRRGVVSGSALDVQFLSQHFAPAVIELIPENLLALGRYFPLFRLPIAQYLIQDTCYTNAAFSLSSGLAEAFPPLSLPVVLTDMVILTKNQLFLVYKLGLALGYSTRWQDYAAEFGGVLGSGFVWRQLARTLVGLIPVWGIAPKVAVAYAGTYVVGNAVLQWYLTGRHLSRQQMRQLYSQAQARGKALAQTLLSKAPRLRLPALRFPRIKPPRARLALPRLPGRKSPRSRLPTDGLSCPQCERSNATDARFCAYCGHPFETFSD
ncbi:MAG: hypothetical protein QME21_18235 [Anaerolineales bacterium]|nr:hypothetical protein [Anaerolineales bacterium]